MIENKEVYIHIGYPKTGTTALQNSFIYKLKEIDFLGQPLTRLNSEMQKVVHEITDCEILEFDETNVSKNINKLLSNNKKLIISEESLSTGSSLSGRVCRYEIAKRLKILFPNAKIIIVIREQKSIIKSFYLQKKKTDINFKMTFDEWFNFNRKNQHKENFFQYFYYDKLVELYKNLFGKDKIKILLFEEFKNDQEYFIKKLINFLELTIDCKHLRIEHDNKTVTKNTLKLLNYNNRFKFIKKIIPIKCKNYLIRKAQDGKKLDLELKDYQIDYINKIYGQSNHSLKILYRLELEKFNYCLGEDDA